MKNSAGVIVPVNPDVVVWNGTTPNLNNACPTYFNLGTTDTNGRILFNLTKDGTTTGTAIFSSVFGVFLQGLSTSTTDLTKAPYFVIEAQTVKQITARAIIPKTVAIGGLADAYGGASLQCYCSVIGKS